MQPFRYSINEFLELINILENEIETDVKAQIQTICTKSDHWMLEKETNVIFNIDLLFAAYFPLHLLHSVNLIYVESNSLIYENFDVIFDRWLIRIK